jgi:hypothetical protein
VKSLSLSIAQPWLAPAPQPRDAHLVVLFQAHWPRACGPVKHTLGCENEMKPEEARDLLQAHTGADDPVILPGSVLGRLSVVDIPADTWIEVGNPGGPLIELEWSGRLYSQNGVIKAEAGSNWYRKFWYQPLGLEHYIDLVKRAIEVRQQQRGDVRLTHFCDDGAFIQIYYEIDSQETNLGKAFRFVEQVSHELHEIADRRSRELGLRVAAVARRVSGWGSQPLDDLVNTVEQAASTDAKVAHLKNL